MVQENVAVISEDHDRGIELEVDIVRVLKILHQKADVIESLDQDQESLCHREGQGPENL